jgi:hypothetical protein
MEAKATRRCCEVKLLRNGEVGTSLLLSPSPACLHCLHHHLRADNTATATEGAKFAAFINIAAFIITAAASSLVVNASFTALTSQAGLHVHAALAVAIDSTGAANVCPLFQLIHTKCYAENVAMTASFQTLFGVSSVSCICASEIQTGFLMF